MTVPRLNPLTFPGAAQLVQSDIPSHLTVAAYRAQRTGRRRMPWPPAKALSPNPKEVQVTVLISTRGARLLAVAAALAVWLLLAVLVDPALAKVSDLGKNLGAEINSWGRSILLGLATFAGLKVFANRNLGEAVVLSLLVVVIGGFLFAQPEVKDGIRALWRAVIS